MTPLEEAQAMVLQRCEQLDVVALGHDEAIGHVLAADVVAAEQVPPFTNSAVDGYAVIATDVADAPTDLAVVDEVAAGSVSTRTLERGQAVRIMTGAPVPGGADAVVMVERTAASPDRSVVSVNAAVSVGAGIREAGSDVSLGETVLRAGTTITPAVAGVLASVNARTVEVIRRPVVAVLATGDELVTTGAALAPGQIRESNLTMLSGLVREAGCDVVDVGVVADDEAELETVLRSVVQACDAIVSTGGVSMGDYDVVKAVLARIADMSWLQVAIKPAKPFAFGELDRTPVFGLPGNPVSSMVSFEMFARPALRKMAGRTRLSRPCVVAIADVELPRRPDGRVHLDRVVASWGPDGRVHVVPARAQGSHQLAATALANALAVIADGDSIPAGAEVAVLLLTADDNRLG